jgi:hypothetical protein
MKLTSAEHTARWQLIPGVRPTIGARGRLRSAGRKGKEIADLIRRPRGLLTAEAQGKRQVGRAGVTTERGAAEGYGGRAGRGRPERANEPSLERQTSRERAKAATPSRPAAATVQSEVDRIQQRLKLC